MHDQGIDQGYLVYNFPAVRFHHSAALLQADVSVELDQQGDQLTCRVVGPGLQFLGLELGLKFILYGQTSHPAHAGDICYLGRIGGRNSGQPGIVGDIGQ